MNKCYNLKLVNLILFGYLIILILPYFKEILLFNISTLQIVFIFYLVVSLILRKYSFSRFIIITYFLLICYLSYINYKSIALDNLWSAMYLDILVVRMYSFVLIPFVFFGWNGDFYSLPYELSTFTKSKVLFIIIPLLVKKELILKRNEEIMDCLYSKGINVRAFMGKQINILKWIIPLGITTIQEGTETSEYNRMLNADFRYFEPKRKLLMNSGLIKIMFFIQVFILLILGFVNLWKYTFHY